VVLSGIAKGRTHSFRSDIDAARMEQAISGLQTRATAAVNARSGYSPKTIESRAGVAQMR